MKKIFQFFMLFACFMFVFAPGVWAQNKTISGIVTDAGGNPLPGVTIIVSGTTDGTITDSNGKYTISLPLNQNSLEFSFVGMKSTKVVVGKKTQINVKLEETTIGLDEVVAVGYGVQKKVNLTGAVAAVEGKTIARKAATDVLSAMEGELPGVAVLRSSGQPGSETSGIRIRGFSSVNDTKALVLIDGVEGDLTLLNPNDIESISILKDAASAAIYGARAAAGVILVTTKSGRKDGKIKISYNGYFGINIPGNMPKRVSAWKEQDMINESRIQQSGNPEWNPEMTSWISNSNFNYRPNASKGRWDYFSATNWINEGTKDYTTQQSHSVSITGGTPKTSYLISTGYYTKNGLLKYGPDKYDRYNFRIKLNSELNKYVSIGTQITYAGTFTDQNPYGAANILERLYRVRARQPIYTPDEDTTDNPYNGDLQVNPIDLMKNGGITKNRYENYTGIGDITIQNVVKGLKLKISASRENGYYNSTVEKRNLVWYNMTGDGIRFQVNNPNSLKKQKNSDYHDNITTTLDYNVTLGKHTLSGLLGTAYEDYRMDEITATASDLNSNDFFSFNYYDNSIPTNSSLGDNIGTWAINSYFGRINYNFDNRYIFEANMRYDGSSKLAASNRWKLFPSLSGAWRINEEKWFKLRNITNFKLRASWGQLGNGAVLGDYDFLPLINSGSQINDSYYYQQVLASNTKTWETIQTTNLGVDLGLFQNRLTFTGDYYWKYNKNMLANISLPSDVGIDAPVANVGELKTWGWEFNIGWRDKIHDFSYRVSFNLSDSQNKLLKYDGVDNLQEGSNALLEGYPLNSIWVYQTDGYWSSRKEYLDYVAAHPGYTTWNSGVIDGGDVKYLNQGDTDHAMHDGGTPKNPGDLVYKGTSNGRYLYGLNISAQYKNFDLSMFFQGVGKRVFLVKTETIAPFFQTSNMPWTIHEDYWTPQNTDAYFPRLYNYKGNDYNFKPADKYLQNGAYIRLKNIQLGYNLPISVRYIEKARVYITGTDVWEHSKVLSVFDPEVGNNASASYYPFFRTWSLGVNVTF